jgi:hypothetical protein
MFAALFTHKQRPNPRGRGAGTHVNCGIQASARRACEVSARNVALGGGGNREEIGMASGVGGAWRGFRAATGRLAVAGALLLPWAAPAAAQPVVSVVATGFVASERGPAPGVFAIQRSGDLSAAVTVGFTLSGTATAGVDYLAWETSARLFSGQDTAYVSVLPRNDAVADPGETVTLTLAAGSGYSVGAPSSAGLTIQDAFVSGLPGVLDPVDYPVLERDLQYLDATVANGSLNLVAALQTSSPLNKVVFFLDTDQDPATGEIRPGRPAGAEYRIVGGIFGVAGFFTADYLAYRLPTASNRVEQQITPLPVTASFDGVFYRASIPLALIGNPAAVDVFVCAAKGLSGQDLRIGGNGDRVPEYGAFDTASRKVVVRRPHATQGVTLTDPAGDRATPAGFDLTTADLLVVADQFVLVLTFTQGFDPRTNAVPGPRGEIDFDSDRRLATGFLPMGRTIPTWGGDAGLLFDFSTSVPLLQMLVPDLDTADTTPGLVIYDEEAGDARWLAGAAVGSPTQLRIAGSLSLLDAVSIDEDLFTGVPAITRHGTGEGLRYWLATLTGFATVADKAPDGFGAVDSGEYRILAPLEFDPRQKQSADDPAEYFPAGTGFDLRNVEGQVIDGNLVVRATLTGWQPTQDEFRFEVHLDTDRDAATGQPIGHPEDVAAPAIGAEYKVTLAVVGGGPVYEVALVDFMGNRRAAHPSLALPRPNANALGGADVTFTIPLELLGAPTRALRLYVHTLNFVDGTHLDTAPPRPMRFARPRGPHARPRRGLEP